MKPLIIAPLVALALAAGSAGGYFWLTSGGGEEEVVVQTTATPTGTAVASATPTASPSSTPLPGGKAPEGCASSEKAYVDPDARFAFCYPIDMDMEVSTSGTGEGQAVTVMHPLWQDNRVVANWGWVFQGRVGLEPDAPCIPSPTIIKNRTIRELTIDSKVVKACFQDHYDRTRPEVLLYKTIQMEVPAKSGDVVQIEVASFGPSWIRNDIPSEELVTRILDSSVVY